MYEITSGNYSAVDAYEPGSVGKVITIAAALNEGTVTPESTFVVPWQKVYTKRGDRLHDSHMHGDEVMSVEQILVESSNIGTITVSETMGVRRLQLRAPVPLHAPVRPRRADGARTSPTRRRAS